MTAAEDTSRLSVLIAVSKKLTLSATLMSPPRRRRVSLHVTLDSLGVFACALSNEVTATEMFL